MKRDINDEMREAMVADIMEAVKLLDIDYIETLRIVVERFLVNQRKRDGRK